MRRNIITLALSLIIPFQVGAQKIHGSLIVPMSLHREDIPFKLNGGCLTWLYEGSFNKFKGIPTYLNNSNSIIKTISFGHSFLVNDSIYLVVGDKNDTESVCIIDSNNDHDFSNDYQYHYNKSSLKDSLPFIPQAIHFKYGYGGREIDRVIYLRPIFYPGGIHYSNPIAQKYFVVFQLAECRIGHFTFNSICYKIAAAMPTPRPLYDSSTVFSIIKYGGKFPSNTNSLNFYNQNKDIIVGGQIFKITNINPLGSSLVVKYMGKRAPNEVGYNENFYAPSIAEHAIDGRLIDLNNYKGKYILLDFWGTWCSPCIKMIPELRIFHEKYRNLIMVSIAYENTDAGTLAKAIKEYRMSWINIYKTFKGNQNLIRLFRIKKFPTTFLINPTGKIIFRGDGNNLSDLKKLLYKVYQK